MPFPPPDEKARAAVVQVYERLRARLQGRFSVKAVLVVAREEFPAEPYYRGIAIGIAVALWQEQEWHGPL